MRRVLAPRCTSSGVRIPFSTTSTVDLASIIKKQSLLKWGFLETTSSLKGLAKLPVIANSDMMEIALTLRTLRKTLMSTRNWFPGADSDVVTNRPILIKDDATDEQLATEFANIISGARDWNEMASDIAESIRVFSADCSDASKRFDMAQLSLLF